MSTTESAAEGLRAWFAGRLPDGWFTGAPEVTLDREEITIVGTLPDPEIDAGASDAERAAAAEGLGRKVSWGVVCGGRKVMFTTFSVPVMTRLRQQERLVLDTLVEAGVARSRSDALAWCVRLVGQHQDSWLAELREALRRVEEVRAEGPLS
jgi:hypothetical protein